MDSRHLYRIVRRRDLPQFVGLQRTQVDELIKKGQFPRPIPLSDTGRAVGWLEDELVGWQRERLAKRDGVGPTKQAPNRAYPPPEPVARKPKRHLAEA